MVSIFHLLYLLCLEIAASRLSSECWKQMRDRKHEPGDCSMVTLCMCQQFTTNALHTQNCLLDVALCRGGSNERRQIIHHHKQRSGRGALWHPEAGFVSHDKWYDQVLDHICHQCSEPLDTVPEKKVLVFPTLGTLSWGVISCVQNLSTCPPVDGAGVLRLCLSVSSESS